VTHHERRINWQLQRTRGAEICVNALRASATQLYPAMSPHYLR